MDEVAATPRTCPAVAEELPERGATTRRHVHERVRLDATPGGELLLVWQDSRNGTCDPFCRGHELFAARSADGGASFAENLRIDPAGVAQGPPALLVTPDGTVLVAWFDGRDGGSHIYLARSFDSGASFEPGLRVDTGAEASSLQSSPSLAAETDGRVWVAWLEGFPRRDVHLARGFDRGAVFEPVGRVHPEAPEVTERANVALTITGSGRLVLVWTEQRGGRWRVQSATSLDGGLSFSEPRPVDSSTAEADQILPSVAAAGADRVYVTWQVDRVAGDRVRIARSTDGADTFEASVLVADPGPEGDQRDPDLDVDSGGAVVVTWVDFARLPSGVYVARSSG
jgi:hypothetical protein